MSEKQKNLIIRAIVGALFVIIMVGGFYNPHTMIALFTAITGLTIWEYTGLVNQKPQISVNRFISTIAGVYLFLAVAALRTGIITNFVVVIPYLLTIGYLLISQLYLKEEDPISDWAYTMLSQLYIALPFSMINVLGFEQSSNGMGFEYHALLPLCIFVFLWLNDTGAYCSGLTLWQAQTISAYQPCEELGREYWWWSSCNDCSCLHRLSCTTTHEQRTTFYFGLDRLRFSCYHIRYLGRFSREPF